MHDERALALVVGAYAQAAAPGLDAKTSALARLAATIALRGELPSYLSNVDAAIDGGADLDEITGVFLAIAPVSSAASAGGSLWCAERLPRGRRRPTSKRRCPPPPRRSHELIHPSQGSW